MGMPAGADAGRTGVEPTRGITAEPTGELEPAATSNGKRRREDEGEPDRSAPVREPRPEAASAPAEWEALAPKERSALEMLLETNPEENGKLPSEKSRGAA